MQNNSLFTPQSAVVIGASNCRTKFYKDKNGNLIPYDRIVFASDVFVPDGYEKKTAQAKVNKNTIIFFKAKKFIDDNFAYYEAFDRDMYTALVYKNYQLMLAESKQKQIDIFDVDRSKRKAKNRFFDYAISNCDLDCMITLTLDPDKINRFDYDTVYSKLKIFLSNSVQRDGLKYLLVNELHKDGAIHMHGLCNSSALKLTKTNLKRAENGENFISALHPERKGKRIYNISNWSFGFSTAIKITDNEKSRKKVINYVCKYITKSEQKIGGRWYLHSQNLDYPIVEYCSVDYDDDKGFEVQLADAPPFKITKNF